MICSISLLRSSRLFESFHWNIWIDIVLLWWASIFSYCPQFAHLLLQYSHDVLIGTSSSFSQKATLQHKSQASELTATHITVSAKDTFMAFIERQMAFDTEVHNEFKRTRNDWCWKEQLFLELWRLLMNYPVIKQVGLLLNTQSSSSADVSCQNIHWFPRNYDNL